VRRDDRRDADSLSAKAMDLEQPRKHESTKLGTFFFVVSCVRGRST
jgi:hypothetical protein